MLGGIGQGTGGKHASERRYLSTPSATLTPARLARFLVCTLLPKRCSSREDGPRNTIPVREQSHETILLTQPYSRARDRGCGAGSRSVASGYLRPHKLRQNQGFRSQTCNTVAQLLVDCSRQRLLLLTVLQIMQSNRDTRVGSYSGVWGPHP